MSDPGQNQSEPEINLDCGRPVSFSYYDDLIGISLRYNHPIIPDPEVIYSKISKFVVHFNDLKEMEKSP